ncbi:MAG: peptidylprolyl isomerase [Alphaproteobacteria bacterium]|nr:peptidylprolyl isomerase [Alphaproteobacteria bacterium]
MANPTTPPPPRRRRVLPLLAAAMTLAVATATAAQRPRTELPVRNPGDAAAIVAVVNGDVVSRADVDNRRRLFALSTGLPVTQEVLDRLTPQVTRQLVDERLRLQEVERRKIVVTDQEIAGAIGQVEKANNMPPGALRAKLVSDGVEMRTLIDQIRVQLGWGKVLREQLGENAGITPADIDAQARMLKAESGKPEFRVGEIFISVDEPAHQEEARRFADTVIQQLRNGAPFAVVAAQFSQSQTALQGGDLGWVQPNQVDPEVAHVMEEMPVGAVSNPIRVAGGFSIITLRAKRQIGNDPATILKVARVLFTFSSALDPQHPTDQQRKQLLRARQVAAGAHSCEQLGSLAQAGGGDVKAPEPTDVRLETVPTPQLRTLLEGLGENKSSQPLVSADGIGLLMVCSREEKNLGTLDRQQIANQLLSERIELASRQLQRSLHRRAVIDMRPGAA